MGRRRERKNRRLENQQATRLVNSRRKAAERVRREARLEAKAARLAEKGVA